MNHKKQHRQANRYFLVSFDIELIGKYKCTCCRTLTIIKPLLLNDLFELTAVYVNKTCFCCNKTFYECYMASPWAFLSYQIYWTTLPSAFTVLITPVDMLHVISVLHSCCNFCCDTLQQFQNYFKLTENKTKSIMETEVLSSIC